MQEIAENVLRCEKPTGVGFYLTRSLTTRGKGTMQVMHTKSNKSNQLNRILLYILPCIALAIIAALSIASRL
ncbi:hypothetical protein IJG29_01525, partial [Candidatus Saccharibacteria bacterium]|nr:hypothetical protein [Candidatus Saccharibacteria bacterium]